MRRWTEIGKDLLIVILVAALLTLTLLALPERTLTSSPVLSAALKPFAGLFGLDQAELTYTEKALPGLDAAQPLAVSVRNSAGRYTAQYDFETLDSVYEALGSMLGQALESAQLEQTTLQKLYSAIAGTSVTFVYPAELPSGVLAEWLGAQAPEAGEAAMLYVLSLQESGAVRLYLCGESCWVGDTALSGDALTQALDSYRPDGSFFALEDGTGRCAYHYAAGGGAGLQPLRRRQLYRRRGQFLLLRDGRFAPHHGGRAAAPERGGAAAALYGGFDGGLRRH